MRTRFEPKHHGEYIAAQPKEVATRLRKIREIVKKMAPDAVEVISYCMPAFKLNGRMLIYYAAHTSHTAIYPAPRSAPELKEELAGYGGGKGTVQFPHEERFPAGLVGRVVKFKVKELREKYSRPAAKKAKSKPTTRKAR